MATHISTADVGRGKAWCPITFDIEEMIAIKTAQIEKQEAKMAIDIGKRVEDGLDGVALPEGGFVTDRGEVVITIPAKPEAKPTASEIPLSSQHHLGLQRTLRGLDFDLDGTLAVSRRPKNVDGKGRRDRNSDEIEQVNQAIAFVKGYVAGEPGALDRALEAANGAYPIPAGKHGPFTVEYETNPYAIDHEGSRYVVTHDYDAKRVAALKKAGGRYDGKAWHLSAAAIKTVIGFDDDLKLKAEKEAAKIDKLKEKLLKTPPKGTDHIEVQYTGTEFLLVRSDLKGVSKRLAELGATEGLYGWDLLPLAKYVAFAKALPELEKQAEWEVGNIAARKQAESDRQAVAVERAKAVVEQIRAMPGIAFKTSLNKEKLIVTYPNFREANALLQDRCGARWDNPLWAVPVTRADDLLKVAPELSTLITLLQEQAKIDEVRRIEAQHEARRKAAANGIFEFRRPSSGGWDGKVGSIEWIGDVPCKVTESRRQRGIDEDDDGDDQWIVYGTVKRIEGPEAEQLISDRMIELGTLGAAELEERLCRTICGLKGTPCDAPDGHRIQFDDVMKGTGQLLCYAEVVFDPSERLMAYKAHEVYVHDTNIYPDGWRVVALPEQVAEVFDFAIETAAKWRSEGVSPVMELRKPEVAKAFAAVGMLRDKAIPAPEGTRVSLDAGPPDEFDRLEVAEIKASDLFSGHRL